MDDKLTNSLIRLRTKGGVQVLLDDTTGSIYMVNKRGNAWFELNANGDINLFGQGSINVRSEQNLNLRADKNINIEVDFMQGKFASTENLAVGIWEQLEEGVIALGSELHCVKVSESENNYAEYFGD